MPMPIPMLWQFHQFIAVSLHIICVILYGFVILWQAALGPKPIYVNPNASFAGDLKYLTYWNLIFQFAFYFTSLIIDCLPRRMRRPGVMKFIDAFYHVISFPFAMFVTITFWTLCSIDPNYVRAQILSNPCPAWGNHIVHTMIAPAALLESLFTYHQIPHFGYAFLLISLIICIYTMWVIYIGLAVEFWVYAMFEFLNWPQRIIFSICSGVMIFLYFIGSKIIHSFFWPRSRIENFCRYYR